MSDAGKELDVSQIWAETGVTMDLPPPRSAKNNKRKKQKEKGVSTSGGPTRQPSVMELSGPQAEQPEGQKDEVANRCYAPSPSASPEGKKKRLRDNSSTLAVLKKQKEIIQERLAEKGKLPSMSDLEACRRVGLHGLNLFNELAELLASEFSKRLEGKISSSDVESRRLEGKLLRVQSELYSFRDINMVSFLEDNGGLKAKLEKLKFVQEELDSAYAKVAEKKKRLERLPRVEKELNEVRNRAETAEAKEKTLEAHIGELTQAKAEHRRQLVEVSVGGFKIVLDITAILAPGVDFKFSGKNVARDEKLYEGDQVAYDPKKDGLSDAEEEEADDQGKTTKAASTGGAA